MHLVYPAVVSALLFATGVYGVLARRNAILVLMSVELMLNAANLTLVAFGRAHHDSRAHAFAFLVMAVAAAEAAVGLAIVLAIYRNLSTVDMERFNLLKW